MYPALMFFCSGIDKWATVTLDKVSFFLIFLLIVFPPFFNCKSKYSNVKNESQILIYSHRVRQHAGSDVNIDVSVRKMDEWGERT